MRDFGGIPAAVHSILDLALVERRETRETIRDIGHEAAISYLDMTSVLLIIVACFMALHSGNRRTLDVRGGHPVLDQDQARLRRLQHLRQRHHTHGLWWREDQDQALAPEMQQAPWSRESRDHLRAIVPRSFRLIEHTTDRYDRTVGAMNGGRGNDPK